MRLSACAAAVVVLVAGACTQLTPAIAGADDLHNVTYRARIDGVSRGTTITFAAEGNQTQTANPTMVPGRIFEAQTVLPTAALAHMRVSVRWPYSANLHCEILIDDALVAQADDFVAPRFLPASDDPDYGALTCEAPVNSVPVEPAVPADGTAPQPPAAAPAA